MKAIIEINKYGTIEVELDREHAPTKTYHVALDSGAYDLAHLYEKK